MWACMSAPPLSETDALVKVLKNFGILVLYNKNSEICALIL